MGVPCPQVKCVSKLSPDQVFVQIFRRVLQRRKRLQVPRQVGVRPTLALQAVALDQSSGQQRIVLKSKAGLAGRDTPPVSESCMTDVGDSTSRPFQ